MDDLAPGFLGSFCMSFAGGAANGKRRCQGLELNLSDRGLEGSSGPREGGCAGNSASPRAPSGLGWKRQPPKSAGAIE